jgi:prepilin-type N-terminal cleavage/methylation domain-containing protein
MRHWFKSQFVGHRRTRRRFGCEGFTLFEVLTALMILAMVSSSVLVVVNRCVASAADSALRMEAFHQARENLEQVLSSSTVTEKIEYGTSERYPDIAWQTVVGAFSEPLTGEMWVRAVCTAEYTDSNGETQTVKLEHWLSPLSDQQADQLVDQENLEQLAAEQLVETLEEAAEYTGLDPEVIEQWVENGLMTTEDGAFLRYNLDIFTRSNGSPTDEEKAQQVQSVDELAAKLRMEQAGPGGGTGGDVDPATGLPYEQLDKMDIGEVMDILKERQR